jgi:hypothetical protein
MIINGGPLNSSPLNGRARTSGIAPPVYVAAGIGYRWRERVTIAGVDYSAQMVDGLDVDREEGAAGVGGIAFYLPPGPAVPDEWIGREVLIDYISTAAGITTEVRLLTARITAPVWDSSIRVMSCNLSDQLQQRVEGMSVAEIDALTAGSWSVDVFEPVEGRSRWDYALERMSTRTASLDCSAYGVPRVSSWYAASPAFVFGPGTVLDESQGVDLADLSRRTNKFVIESDYRYARLRQKNESFTWLGGGFCGWYFPETKELPTIEMVAEAVEDAGGTLLDGATYDILPPSHPDPCATGTPWVNVFTNLLLGTTFSMGRRWAQSITERYELSVLAPASIAATGEVIARAGEALEVESLLSEAWDSEPFTGGISGHTDERDEPRRTMFLIVQLQQGVAVVVSSHRSTTVTWQVPTSMAMGIDLTQTLELDDMIKARGKCSRISHRLDVASGAAVTALTISVMRGGGAVSDPLTLPASLDEAQPLPLPAVALPTQIGGYSGVPAYDEALPGFAGNFSVSDIFGPVMYPRRFDVPAAELTVEQRDELPVPITATYNVAIPNDLLEL